VGSADEREERRGLGGECVRLLESAEVASALRLAPAPDVGEPRGRLGTGRALQLVPSVGAWTRSSGASGPSSQRVTSRRLSQYGRAEDAAARRSQESISVLRIRFSAIGVRGSVQESSFSPVHAARPAGESVSAYPTVCGRVRCRVE